MDLALLSKSKLDEIFEALTPGSFDLKSTSTPLSQNLQELGKLFAETIQREENSIENMDDEDDEMSDYEIFE